MKLLHEIMYVRHNLLHVITTNTVYISYVITTRNVIDDTYNAEINYLEFLLQI